MVRIIVLPRRVLAWLALAACCAALLWYAVSGPPAATTGVAVHQPLSPARPHESGTPAPTPEEAVSRGRAVETVMERERSRSERMEWLRSMAADPGTSALTRDDVQRRMLEELDRATKEAELEALLAAEGFADTVVVLNDQGLTLSVRGRLADAAVAARLGEMASRMTGVSPERIVIIDGR